MMKNPFTASVLALALSALPASALSQAVVQPLPGTTDADRLAATMRRVAAAPNDVAALIEAAELSVRLDDASAAASLFARAEKIDPQNGRVKAGMGAILVRAERPGEALRYFNQAEGYGWPAMRYASDRGLAYDLLGEQERAQRDYRVALRAGADDETLRRYALSLAISGRREPALEQLEPLVRRQDRGAWRTQAFVLALTGDAGGADRIATSMMPAAAAGLAPFFRRLPALPAVDRAFAVHFGEVRASPDRLADARMAPALAALTPEADPFARRPQVAAVQAVPRSVPAPSSREERRRDRRTRGRGEPARTAIAAATPVPTPAPAVLPATLPAPVQVASAPPAPLFQPPRPVIQSLPTPAPTPAPVAAPRPAVQLAAVAPAPRPATPVRDADSVLARIVASIKIPAAELEAAAASPALAAGRREVARERADRAAAVRTIRAARPAAEKAVASRGKVPAGPAAVEEAEETTPVRTAGRGRRPARTAAVAEAAEEAPARTTRRGARQEVAAAKPGTEARGKAAGTKGKAARAETAAQRAAKAEPERIWVQVAGGANEGDLGKAWTGAKKQASALSGRAAYTTKSRATNRVVTGPFKTDAEARAFVNKLRSQGVGAFSFTSDAGQKMAKLPAK